MLPPSEKGHAKNVANLKKAIAYATGWPNYNPANQKLTPTALSLLWQTGDNAVSAVSAGLQQFRQSVNDRQNLFKPVSLFVTRLSGSVNSTENITTTAKADFAALVRKYRGARAEAVAQVAAQVGATGVTPATEPAEQHSVAQLSYDFRVTHFKSMIDYIDTLTNYAPNESEFQLANLRTKLLALQGQNDNTMNAAVVLDTARIARDKVLYAPQTGMGAVMEALKEYGQSLTGFGSAEHKQVKKISFTYPKKKEKE